MARGWESKSVESQMEAAESRRGSAAARAKTEDQILRERERESLELTRKRVLKDIEAATHPRHRAQLEAALAHVEKRIQELT
jgi:hypothetical protein